MSLSTIFGFGTPPDSTAPTTPDSTAPTAPTTPTTDKCESPTLLGTKEKIITAINDLIESYESCNEDTCKLEACDQKFYDLVQALEENYNKINSFVSISKNIKYLVKNNSINKKIIDDLKNQKIKNTDNFFNDTDPDILVFESVLKFLNNNFLTQLKKEKIEYLNLLKNILNPETKGGRRKSRKNKSKKNKSRKNKSRKNMTKTMMTQK